MWLFLETDFVFFATGLNGLMYENHLEWYLFYPFPSWWGKVTSLLGPRSKRQLQTWAPAPWPLHSLPKLLSSGPFRPPHPQPLPLPAQGVKGPVFCPSTGSECLLILFYNELSFPKTHDIFWLLIPLSRTFICSAPFHSRSNTFVVLRDLLVFRFPWAEQLAAK